MNYNAPMQECGLDAVPLDHVPGRIAECLADITVAHSQAVANGDLEAIANGVDKLKRLRLALDAFDVRSREQLEQHLTRK